ncbi:MAG: glycosyltransferase family 2 protein [Methyloprofundus sp.]|nr:glycosyltransferase family 2 protein [Methyloprofundus sp.]
MQQKITIVICTHNRSNLLLNAIHSISDANSLTDQDISILVIANACSDDTLIKLKELKEQGVRFPLSFAVEPTPGKSFALAHAINLIDDGFICFIDDDQRVDKNYLQAILNAIHKHPEISFFCGPIFPDWMGTEPSWVHTQDEYKIYPEPVPCFDLGSKPIKITHETTLPAGGTLIVKKDVFQKIGTFSTDLGPKGHNLVGGEDSDFVLRALNAGETILYMPDIIQYHYVDPERLKLSFLILNSFQRTRSFTLINSPDHSAIPLYMWRKLFNYIASLLISFNRIKIRFYLMRIASTIGEISGLRGGK